MDPTQLTEDDAPSDLEIPPPTKRGFYKYSSGNQVMIFLLDYSGQWWTIFDNAHMSQCEWGYIEQCLGVYDLIPVETACYEGKKD